MTQITCYYTIHKWTYSFLMPYMHDLEETFTMLSASLLNECIFNYDLSKKSNLNLKKSLFGFVLYQNYI